MSDVNRTPADVTQTAHADLIAEARGFTAGSDPTNARTSLINALADALEAEHFDLDGHRRLLADAEADLARARDTIARVGEYLVAIQNSPGLGETGHHERWLREARAVLAAYYEGTETHG